MKYVIISPVRNEEDYLELTLKSVINQTVRPVEFILVNDGSTDSTPDIIDRYTARHEWIRRLDLEDRGHYLPGKGVVNAFYAGFNKISDPDWQYVVKLDCDLEFGNDYFERILEEFDKNPKLGIASGCTYLPSKGPLVKEPTQEDHPVGPSKVYKSECWAQIGGMKKIPGWDLADLLDAQMKGWETRCFFDLKLIHYRLTGSRRKGVWVPKFLQGQFEYKHGYSFTYTLIKAIKNVFSKPLIIGSIAKVTGYLFSFLKKEDYLFDKEMRSFLRMKHRKLLLSRLGIKK